MVCTRTYERLWELKKLEDGLAINVGKDLDWLNSDLEGKRFLAGQEVIAADMMCIFSVQFIFKRTFVVGGGCRSGGMWRGGCERVRKARGGRGLWGRRDMRCNSYFLFFGTSNRQYSGTLHVG
jgi:glutathione S-transferase